VTYGNGLFVAVASTGAGNRVMTSPDGITWTAHPTAASYYWGSVAYGNGLFVAVASTGTGDRVMTSPDGANWTLQTTPADNLWQSVTYGNGLFVAVAFSGTGNRVMTSPDGINWTLQTSAADYSWFGVTYGHGLFVAVAKTGTGNRVMASPDGITWSAQSSAADNEWSAVTYGKGTFMAVATTGTNDRVMTWQSQMAINAGNNQTATSGTAVATAPSVIVRNPLNNPVSGVSVTFSVGIGGGAVSGGTATTNASGIATVGSWILGSTAGANTLTATSSGLTGSPLTFTATGTVGAATQIAINGGNNQTATVGTAVATAPSVIVKDALNNPVPGVSVTFAVATGGGTVNPTTAVTTDANGLASVTSWTLGPTAGSNTLTATVVGLTGSPLTFTATGTAGAATKIAIYAGNSQTATVGTAVATAPGVLVQDASNNPVAGVSVTFTVATGGGSIVVAGGGSNTVGTATTNASGIATVGSWTLGTTAGSNTLTATSAGLTGSPLTFTATGTPAPATQIAINAGNNQTATVGTAVAIVPSVIVRDASNSPVAGVTVTFAVATGGGSVTGGTATTDASGIATVGSWTLGTTAGSNTLTATSAGLTGSPLTFTATGTPAPATQIAINAGNNQTATVGTAVAIVPSVIVRDASNSPVAGVTVTFAVATGGGSVTGGTATTDASGIATVGSWTLGTTAGSNTLTATSAGLTGSPLTFTATATPAVTADPPTAVSQPGGEIGPGGTLTVTQKLTNPSSAPATVTYVASLPEGLTGVSCSVPLGTCVIGGGTVNAPGGGEIYRTQAVSSLAATSTVTWTGTIPGNTTVTISYVTQVGAVATSGTQYLITSTINGFPGPSATVTVSATPVGPGDPIGLVLGQAAAQKPGSVLIYNLYSSGLNPQTNDSRISITNTSPSRRAYVHFFFIDGSNCSVADMTITLTANQTTSFLASDFDPGVTGYLIAVATDANGCPAIQNDLIGESHVKLESGHRATLPALGVAALGLGGATCNLDATTATLAFDGLSYNALPRSLAVSGLSSIANGFSSLLVVNRIGGNLGTGAATLGSLFGLLYDDQEASQSFTLPGNVCQLRGVMGNNFPRTVPRYTTVIPAGRTGWMRFAAVEDEAITGLLLVEAQNGLGGGHNLHHLTTTSTATLTIPVYPA
jgi:adhesin/invasin